MKERPILFSSEMVRAILEGRKTQTRRILKPNSDSPFQTKCPYGQPGDRLWVRETFAEALGDYAYRANYSADVLAEKRNQGFWKPSIHMPRIASRITLEIVSVRVERLQDISEDDAKAEGVSNANTFIGIGVDNSKANRYAFRQLWQSINGAESWDANPFVWVIEFRRVKP